LIKLIVGLGNPGNEYARNRHNVGFHCINQLAKQNSIDLKQRQCQSRVGTGTVASTKVVLAKPGTFVNRSGEAVKQLMRKHSVEPKDILIIYDDLDLSLGKIRLRQNGSSGGHKGMKSIIASLGSQDFCRIKIGIGRPHEEKGSNRDEELVVDHVLSDFTSEETSIIKPAIIRAAEAAEYIVAQGIEEAMNKFN
jgi:PTH1 family peptidyl-tRNA hydrolase